MYLYNIHTHKPDSTRINDYSVRCIVNTSPAEYNSLAHVFDNTFFSCGIHPWYAVGSSSEMDVLREIANNESIVAIGESGLDKLRGADMDIQVQVFKQQIELAIQLEKPLIIHCVKAWDELIALYKEYRPANRWIIHGYRGNRQQAEQLSRLGFAFSIGDKFNETALKSIPLDSIFCETDTADIHIYTIYQNIAAAIGVDIDKLISIVADNVERTFFKSIENVRNSH